MLLLDLLLYLCYFTIKLKIRLWSIISHWLLELRLRGELLWRILRGILWGILIAIWILVLILIRRSSKISLVQVSFRRKHSILILTLLRFLVELIVFLRSFNFLFSPPAFSFWLSNKILVLRLTTKRVVILISLSY